MKTTTHTAPAATNCSLTYARYTVLVRLTDTQSRRETVWAACGLHAASMTAKRVGWDRIRKVLNANGQVSYPISATSTK